MIPPLTSTLEAKQQNNMLLLQTFILFCALTDKDKTLKNHFKT